MLPLGRSVPEDSVIYRTSYDYYDKVILPSEMKTLLKYGEVIFWTYTSSIYGIPEKIGEGGLVDFLKEKGGSSVKFRVRLDPIEDMSSIKGFERLASRVYGYRCTLLGGPFATVDRKAAIEATRAKRGK